MIQAQIVHVPVTDFVGAVFGALTRRLRRVGRAPALLALALFGASPAGAIGPETPVDFLDVYVPKGFMLLVIEPNQVTHVELMRIVHQDGEPLIHEQVEWRRLRMLDYTAPITRPDDFQYRDPREQKSGVVRPQAGPSELPSIDSAQARPDLALADASAPVVVSDVPPRRIGVLIPLEPPSQAELKDGAYAEKFIVRARLAGESANAKPLTQVRWSHFVMHDRAIRFISQAEYSRMVDPPVHGVDGAGGKIQINLGRDVKADVPADKTKLNPAVPLGPLGGLVPERDDSRKPCDEAQEQ
jgi:hypothetical protein